MNEVHLQAMCDNALARLHRQIRIASNDAYQSIYTHKQMCAARAKSIRSKAYDDWQSVRINIERNLPK